jgi:hypothetical protein
VRPILLSIVLNRLTIYQARSSSLMLVTEGTHDEVCHSTVRLLIDSYFIVFVQGVEYNIRGCVALGGRNNIIAAFLSMLS